jgi:hypothetical protein
MEMLKEKDTRRGNIEREDNADRWKIKPRKEKYRRASCYYSRTDRTVVIKTRDRVNSHMQNITIKSKTLL